MHRARGGVLKLLLWLMVGLVALFLVAVWRVGAWNLVFPSTDHDRVAPELPGDLNQPAVLVFSKTNGFRHADGIEGGSRVLAQMTEQEGWGVFFTENGAVFNTQDLSRFATVVFLNASGDMLNEAQELAFQRWLEGGGGWLGVHAAGDGSHKGWSWYRQHLIGADFTAHIMGPQFQTATVVMEQPGHPAAADLPAIWEHEEEWYSWEKSPRLASFNVLATLDETSYNPVQKMWRSERDLRMGDHPVVWTNCVGKGRSLYFAMGHRGDAFEQPQVRRLLVNGLRWLTQPSADSCDSLSRESASRALD